MVCKLNRAWELPPPRVLPPHAPRLHISTWHCKWLNVITNWSWILALWRVPFWRGSQIDHRRLREAHAQIYLDDQGDGQTD